MNIELKHLIPLVGVVLVLLALRGGKTSTPAKEGQGFGGPVDYIIEKVIGVVGGDVENLRTQVPRSQKIHRAANDAAEAFAKSMNEPSPPKKKAPVPPVLNQDPPQVTTPPAKESTETTTETYSRGRRWGRR